MRAACFGYDAAGSFRLIVSLARARSPGSISNNNELPRCSGLSVVTVAEWRSLTGSEREREGEEKAKE